MFEISPFYFFDNNTNVFLELYNRDEIIFLNSMELKFRYNKFISFISLIVGILVVLGFYTLSSNLKNNYLIFKNKFTDDNKYSVLMKVVVDKR